MLVLQRRQGLLSPKALQGSVKERLGHSEHILSSRTSATALEVDDFNSQTYPGCVYVVCQPVGSSTG